MTYRLLNSITASFLFLTVFMATEAQSQNSINLQRDTISSTAAKAAANKFKNEQAGSNKKATTYTKFSVAQLKEIMDNCQKNGIDTVRFVIATIQQQDIAHYTQHHPGLTVAQKNDLIGRQVLLIKVPRAAFASETGTSANQKNNPLLLSLMAYGWIPLDKPYGQQPAATGEMYLEIGVICPPPASCD